MILRKENTPYWWFQEIKYLIIVKNTPWNIDDFKEKNNPNIDDFKKEKKPNIDDFKKYPILMFLRKKKNPNIHDLKKPLTQYW